MNDELRDLRYRQFEESNPELLHAALADKHLCLDIVGRMDDRAKFALALFVLAYHWPPDASVIERCRQLVGNNMVHEDYRAAAMNYLAEAHKGTKDPITVAALIAIIRDELNIEGLRLLAYYGFLDVISYSRSLLAILFSRMPETTRGIDWRLVEKWSRDCQEQQ
jgi:hypothetical protein